jgi:hypothetical protein
MILEAAIPNVGQRYAFAQPTNQVSGQALVSVWPKTHDVGWGDEGTPTLNSSASNQLGFASSPQPTKFWGFRSDTI